jgi:hypothetical protein
VAFTRLTDDQGRVRIFSDILLMDSTLDHQYLQGTIFIKAGCLMFTHHGPTARRYPYAVAKPP